MKQDTLEEKIVADFEAKTDAKNFPTEEYHSKGGDHLLDPEWYPESDYELDRDKIIDWLRTTLTSYRNDVLEEVLEGMPTKISIDPILGRRSIYNDGWNECIDNIRHLITSLKVDIIKR